MREQGEYLLVIKLDFFCPALIHLPLLFLIFLGYVIYKHDKKKKMIYLLHDMHLVCDGQGLFVIASGLGTNS